MKLINYDLKDKWILDSGATNHMTGNSELLDGTTCLVPSISVYLGNNEKLMETRIGSFKSPKISIPVLVAPCAQLCADLKCWMLHLRQRRTKLSSLQTLCKPIYPEVRPTIKVPMSCHSFSKGNINIWHRLLRYASMETLVKLGFHREENDCHICHQGKLKYFKFSRRTSYAR